MELWSAGHLGALAATPLVAALLVLAVRRAPPARAVAITRALAVVLVVAFLTEQAVYLARGTWSARVNLPFQLTDAVTLVAVIALWRPHRTRLATELLFFWALAASLQGLLTPDLSHGIPDPRYFTFVVGHAGAIVAAVVLVVGLGRVPRPGALWRAYGATAAFAVLAAAATLVTGGNYLYLRRKPSGGSLLDVMGPWPVYIAVAAALALALFAALEALAGALRRASAARPPLTPAGPDRPPPSC